MSHFIERLNERYQLSILPTEETTLTDQLSQNINSTCLYKYNDGKRNQEGFVFVALFKNKVIYPVVVQNHTTKEPYLITCLPPSTENNAAVAEHFKSIIESLYRKARNSDTSLETIKQLEYLSAEKDVEAGETVVTNSENTVVNIHKDPQVHNIHNVTSLGELIGDLKIEKEPELDYSSLFNLFVSMPEGTEISMDDAAQRFGIKQWSVGTTINNFYAKQKFIQLGMRFRSLDIGKPTARVYKLRSTEFLSIKEYILSIVNKPATEEQVNQTSSWSIGTIKSYMSRSTSHDWLEENNLNFVSRTIDGIMTILVTPKKQAKAVPQAKTVTTGSEISLKQIEEGIEYEQLIIKRATDRIAELEQKKIEMDEVAELEIQIKLLEQKKLLLLKGRNGT